MTEIFDYQRLSSSLRKVDVYKTMRIVFISRKYCRGEAWCNRLLAYAKEFQKKGVKVTLLFLAANGQSADSDEDFTGLNIRYISEFSDNDNRLVKFKIYGTAILKIQHYINKGDILFTSDGGGLFLPFLFIHRKSNYVFSEITEHPDIFGIGTDLRGISGCLKKSLHSLRVGFNNLLIRKLTGLFVISNGLRNYYLSHGVDHSRICKVNMFVDTNRFNIPKVQSERYIAYCGTMSISKDGVDVLINAFYRFHKTYPDYKLILIGPYMNQKTKEVIEKLTDSPQIKDSVVLTGKVSPSQMPSLLMNASILALSRPDNIQNRNGFPTKLGEYLATGNPVVVTSIGEIPDYLKEGKNAYLAVPGDDISFANALLRIAKDYDAAKIVGKKGRELALTDFSADIQTTIALNHIKKFLVE